MDSRLLVPATPALLDGWCGPVLAHVYDKPEPCVLIGPSVLELDDGTEVTHYALHVVEGATFDTAPVEDIALDLSRAECRDRVARVLARTKWPDRDLAMASAPRWFGSWTRSEEWMLEAEVVHAEKNGRRWGGCAAADFRPADLDPNDDTRLPDGSRLVDALALAAVAREVPCAP